MIEREEPQNPMIWTAFCSSESIDGEAGDKLTSTSYPKARQAKLPHSPAISGADNHTKVTASDLSPAMLCSSS